MTSVRLLYLALTLTAALVLLRLSTYQAFQHEEGSCGLYLTSRLSWAVSIVTTCDEADARDVLLTRGDENGFSGEDLFWVATTPGLGVGCCGTLVIASLLLSFRRAKHRASRP